jgi:hypothetical protein
MNCTVGLTRREGLAYAEHLKLQNSCQLLLKRSAMLDFAPIANEIDGCGNECSQAEAILPVQFHSGRRERRRANPCGT